MKPRDNTKLSALILKGYSNEEIRAELGPLDPSRMYNCRRKLGMVQGIRSSQDTHQEPAARYRPEKPVPKACPKCSNRALDGRSGYPIPVSWACVKCGLTNESGHWYDAINNREVPM